jgi:hypothetical protein
MAGLQVFRQGDGDVAAAPGVRAPPTLAIPRPRGITRGG